MLKIELTQENIEFLNSKYRDLVFDKTTNIIHGILHFELIYPDDNGVYINDSYNIEINLNRIPNIIIPEVREIGNRIFNFAKSKNIFYGDLHINSEKGELCLIHPLKIYEEYQNGFELDKFIKHIENHLYWVSFFEKFNKPPWKEYEHGRDGYLQLYFEDKNKYGKQVKEYFGNPSKHKWQQILNNYIRRKLK